MINRLFLISSLCALTLGLLWPSSAFAQPSVLEQIIQTQPALVDIKAELIGFYKSPRAQTVFDSNTGRFIQLRNLKKATYARKGAGIIIHDSGIIVTNGHIVDKANLIIATLHNGQKVSAKLLFVINNLDIAYLKIEPPFALQSVEIADSDMINLGQEILTVGSSPVLHQTITGGQVIGLGTSRTLQKYGINRTDLIQTSFNLYEGDSGGPLFDQKGRLIGLMTAKETASDHSSFAVPSNQILKYLYDYLKQSALSQEGHE